MSAATPIVMPKLGLTMTEGLLAAWQVGPGDTVRAGDVLFVVETEKIATEIAAQQDGRIGAIHVPEGETVAVGTVLAEWGDGTLVRESALPVSIAATPGASPSPPAALASVTAAPSPAGRLVATPLAKRLARRAGLDLGGIAGSGPHGRIKAIDVQAALDVAPVPAEAAPRDATPRSGGTRRPASGVEKVIARRLGEAKRTIPHFYVLAEADVTALLALREELNGEPGRPRLSITHFIMAAVGRALLAMPDCNRVWEDEEIVSLPASDVGLAVDGERGLMVPVLRDAGRLSLDDVAQACAALVTRARAGRLDTADLAGGAISVSNVGMFGASHLVPIVNPGQAAILGVAAEKPVFRPDAAGAPVLRREIGLVLSCDHRVLDGVRAARFLDHVVALLAHPLRLLRGAPVERDQP